MATGKFVVFEGIDGAGSETQSKLFYSHAAHHFGKKAVIYFDYPNYKRDIGKLIELHLHGKLKITKQEAFLMFFLDQLRDKEKIENALKGGKIVVANRYYTSNMAYNCDHTIKLKDAIKLAEIFKLPKPDFVYYLDISPNESLRRKSHEKGGFKNLDINEKNVAKLIAVRKNYYRLANNHIWLHNWIIVDGQRSKAAIAEEIWNKFLKSE